MTSRTPVLRSNNANIYATALSQFAVCRQPWNEYINLLSRQDTTPYHTTLHDKPAYRGRKKGRESWIFPSQVQLHYRLFPDEHIFTNLTRWRQGDTIGDVALQQFRGAQPFDLEEKDPQGRNRPLPETYMKLNYKNPAVLSRFLTKTGHLYPADILPMNPEGLKKLRNGKLSAIRIGLYPRQGNPFWKRSQKYRPKPFQESYDPTTYDTKKTVEHFAYNWAQTERIRTYFASLSAMKKDKSSASTIESKQQDHFYARDRDPIFLKRMENSYSSPVEKSGKITTVPGLMSTKGMKKKFHNLYSSTSTKRMGFPNPVYGIKKI
jgi:ribosomal protein S18